MVRRRVLWCTLGLAVLTAMVGGGALVNGKAPTTAARPSTAVDPDVLAARDAAWRAWFGGDDRTLGAMLPPEFIAIAARGNELSDRSKTLAASRAFKASGGRLASLSFGDTRAQRYGDAMILYSSYEAVIDTGAARETLRGRATEIFVRRDGRWIHPGWHLDAQP
jgi:hypothetical protein